MRQLVTVNVSIRGDTMLGVEDFPTSLNQFKQLTFDGIEAEVLLPDIIRLA